MKKYQKIQDFLNIIKNTDLIDDFHWIEDFHWFPEFLNESDFKVADLELIVIAVLNSYSQLIGRYGEEGLYYIIKDLRHKIPIVFKKVILDTFEKDDTNFIKIILESQFWEIELNEFRNISDKIKSKFFKYLILALDDSEYFFYAGEIVERLLLDFFNLWDKPKNIFLEVVTELLITRTAHQYKSIIRFNLFYLDDNLLKDLNYSNLLLLKKFLKGVICEEETEGFMSGWEDKYYEELHLLGKDKIYELSKNLFKLIEEGDDKILLTIIRLRWLEHLGDENFIYLLENQKFKFPSKMVNLMKNFLSQYDRDYDMDYNIFFIMSLLQRICNLEDKQYLYSIINQLDDHLFKYITMLENSVKAFDY